MIGCAYEPKPYEPQTPAAQLLIEPCRLDLGEVSNSDEVLIKDAQNWSCASQWLQGFIAWQEWYLASHPKLD